NSFHLIELSLQYKSYQVFFFQAEDGIRGRNVTGVQTCAIPISNLFMVESPFPTMGLGLVWGNGTPCHTAMLPQNDAGFQYSYNIHHLGLFFKGRALSNGGLSCKNSVTKPCERQA